jgi:molecular chaperone DnaK
MTKIAGIDLGTTFSAIAHLNEMGKPTIIPNKEGDRIMASAVYFDDGQILTGTEAINTACRDDESRCVRWIKRHMGDADHKVLINGKEYTPAEISAIILKKLYQDAVPQVGEITDVVISVPANFEEVARKATMDAGKIAGLNVIGIVNEPTAAALYYAIEHKVSGRVLVFDLGGGTFDVTIADVDGTDIQVVTSEGSRNLGGYNFDQELVGYFEAEYRNKNGAELVSPDCNRTRLELEAEDVKKSLSRREQVNTKLKEDRHATSREKFEELISSHLATIEMLIETALDGAECKPSDIDKVLLAGGSSRIPAVQRLLKKMFGCEPTLVGNVDECVALGAALYAGLRLMEESPEKVPAGIKGNLRAVSVGEVANASYGTICISYDEVREYARDTNDIIIPKNTPLPCSETKTYSTVVDGQKRISTEVTQGEDSDPALVVFVATGCLELPPGLPKGTPINATYTYDKDQRMSCVFEHEASGRKVVINLDTKSGQYSTETLNEKRAKLDDFVIE